MLWLCHLSDTLWRTILKRIFHQIKLNRSQHNLQSRRKPRIPSTLRRAGMSGAPGAPWVTPWMSLPPGSAETLVLLPSGLFSPILRVLLLCPFPHCHPVPSPSDIRVFCSVAEWLESWSFLLLSLSSLALLPSTAPFPRAATSRPSSRTCSYSSSSTSPHWPLCSFFFLLYSALTKRGQRCQSRSGCPCLVQVWQWPLGRAMSGSTPRSPCTPSLQEKLRGQDSLQGEYLHNTITNWMYKKVQYFEDAKFKCVSLGVAKGICFKIPLQSVEALQFIKKKIKTAGKMSFRWLKQCVFS